MNQKMKTVGQSLDSFFLFLNPIIKPNTVGTYPVFGTFIAYNIFNQNRNVSSSFDK